MPNCQDAFIKSAAVQNIEYLRRLYARATDLLGIGTKESIAEGRKIYHRIFSADVTFSLSSPDANPLSAKGPDDWESVVIERLRPLGPTQHLIGTQLVEIRSLTLGDDGDIQQGKARMESYVQAWHEVPGNKVWLFLGTYSDDVEFNPDAGWQIRHMELRRVSGETRPMDDSIATVPDL